MTLLDIFLGEFLGTMFLIILGNGVVSNAIFKKTIGNNSNFLAITVGWGFAVFMGVIVANAFGTGGHLNPAVTIMQWTKGDIYVDKAFVYFASEFVGALVGQLIVVAVYWQHIKEPENKDAVLSMHSTGPTHNKTITNLISEFVGTGVLVSVAMILGLSMQHGDTSETTKHIMGFVGPLSMGFVVWGIGISLGGTTGYAINPFRDLAPRIVYTLAPYPNKKSANWSYGWIPVVAPLAAGAVIGLFGRLI